MVGVVGPFFVGPHRRQVFDEELVAVPTRWDDSVGDQMDTAQVFDPGIQFRPFGFGFDAGEGFPHDGPGRQGGFG
jgi:hypothetical protein